MSVHDDDGFGLLLLFHLLRCPTVIGKATDKLLPEDFNRAGERARQMMWAISRDWYKQNRTTIPRHILELEIRARLNDSPSELSVTEQTNMWQHIEAAYTLDSTMLTPDWILQQLELFLTDRRLKPMLQMAASMSAGEDQQKLLLDIGRAQVTSSLKSASALTCFTSSTKRTVSVERQKTGVLFIDHMFAGGTLPGELYGILAPSGGGKTATGIAVLTEAARRQRHAALFSYETEVEPEISNRIYMVAAELPRDSFKDLKSIDLLATAHTADLNAALDRVGPYLHVFDMKKDLHKGIGAGGPAEIRVKLRDEAAAGNPITIVVIDQLLSMVGPYMNANGIKVDNIRLAIHQLIEGLRDIAQEMKCSIFILHQTDNETKRRSPTTQPKGGQAAEYKSFENNMHFCVQFGTQDSQGISWLTSVKHRYSAPESIIVQHNKTHWRIDWDEGKNLVCTAEGFINRKAQADSYNTESAAAVDRKDITKEDV